VYGYVRSSLYQATEYSHRGLCDFSLLKKSEFGAKPRTSASDP
jgi:hypothetical protein